MIIFIIKKSKQINVTCLSVCCLKQVPTSTTCNWRQKEFILPASPYREIQAIPEGKSSPPRYTFPPSVLVFLSPLIIWGAQSQQARNTDPSVKCLKIPNAPANRSEVNSLCGALSAKNKRKLFVCRNWWAIDGDFHPLPQLTEVPRTN